MRSIMRKKTDERGFSQEFLFKFTPLVLPAVDSAKGSADNSSDFQRSQFPRDDHPKLSAKAKSGRFPKSIKGYFKNLRDRALLFVVSCMM